MLIVCLNNIQIHSATLWRVQCSPIKSVFSVMWIIVIDGHCSVSFSPLFGIGFSHWWLVFNLSHPSVQYWNAEENGRSLATPLTQDAYLLLKHCCALPKLLYILRSAPCFASSLLQEYNIILCWTTSAVTNIHFGEMTQPGTKPLFLSIWMVVVFRVWYYWHLLLVWLQLLPPLTWFPTLFHLSFKVWPYLLWVMHINCGQ